MANIHLSTSKRVQDAGVEDAIQAATALYAPTRGLLTDFVPLSLKPLNFTKRNSHFRLVLDRCFRYILLSVKHDAWFEKTQYTNDHTIIFISNIVRAVPKSAFDLVSGPIA